VNNPDKSKQKECASDITNVNFDDPDFYNHQQDINNPNYKYIQKFIQLLGLCHTIIEEHKPDGTMKYNASSPDELALTNAARYFGFEFYGRDADNNIKVKN
jgi:phospholipid-transporting ATPase